jgi:Ca2+-binding RTX toxin-like protein
MATLTVTQSENYIDGNPSVANTDQIVFTNATTALATFSSTQFGGANISNTVGITGNGSTNLIEVQVALDATFSAAGWTSFASWTDATDRVTLVGTTGAETITGSSRADLIEGRAGADTLSGGDGDDIFDYRNGSHLVAGESISGGAGDDSVLLSIGINVDFSLATTFSSIETLRMLASGTSSATFSGTQIGSGAVDTVIGLPTATQAIIVNGNTVNLSGVTFTNWTGANQTITINGTNAGANILFGSNKNDSIIGTGNSIDAMRGGGGADSLTGGGGDDNFNYAAAGEVVAGETILGGSGTDRITLTNAGTNDFSLASINSVETLDFDSGNSTAIFIWRAVRRSTVHDERQRRHRRADRQCGL